MSDSVLNVTINTATKNGELLKNLILSTDYDGAWMCASWVDRLKYNQAELLRECEDKIEKMRERIEKLEAWIEKVIDKFEYYEIGTPEEVSLLRFCRFAVELKKLIDEAPI